MKKAKVTETEKIETEEKEQKPVDAAPVEAAAPVETEKGGGLADVIENKNEVVPEAVAKAKESAAAPKEVATDEDGFAFNPAIHIADANGKPVMNVRGYLMKKRGRKKGCAPNKLNIPDGKPGTVAQELELATMKRQQAAYLSGTGFINVGILIFGEEWLPEKTPAFDETAMVVQAFDDYYKVKGVADIPPGIALVIALGGYGIKRFAKPATKTKLQLIAGSIIERVKGFFNRLRGKKGTPKNGAYVDTRHDENGKDNASGGTRPA